MSMCGLFETTKRGGEKSIMMKFPDQYSFRHSYLLSLCAEFLIFCPSAIHVATFSGVQ